MRPLQGLTFSARQEILGISGRTADKLYSPLCFTENDATDTQVWREMCPLSCILRKSLMIPVNSRAQA